VGAVFCAIKFAGNAEKTLTYDVVADCAGASRQIKSRNGYVELTRSGLEYYADWKQPVFSADSGVLKKLETVLGTGEGFLRAMKQLGYNDFQNKNVLIFGGGKVGRGVAHYAKCAGAQVTVADLKAIELPSGISFVNAADSFAVKKCIADAWCIVSVTGLAGALKVWANDLVKSSAIIANMGVEDEFGIEVPVSRVLNNKHPLNFILDEPTHLKYIDATMALNNYGIEKLIFDTLPCGINFPPAELEKSIVADIKNGGIIAAEMEFIISELD
jgi:adenosylhomocysteinase